MFGPMTSSPKRKPKQKEAGGPRLPPIVSDSIWCGDEKEEVVGRVEGEVRRRDEEVRRRREEEMRGVNSEPPVMLRLEEELKELATGGRTKDLLHLLEEGAPFVVDMVSPLM